MSPEAQSITSEAEEPSLDDSKNKFLLFTLKDELYGAPLISIREVLKLGSPKPVPYMARHFSGVINLRGQIVSIIDMRVKFDLAADSSGKGLVMVVETKEGVIGAVIDDLVCVKSIPPGDLETLPHLDTKIPVKFYLGVAKTDKGLVNIVDVAGIVQDR